MRGATQILWVVGALTVVGLGFVAGPAGAGLGVGALAVLVVILGLAGGVAGGPAGSLVPAASPTPVEASAAAEPSSLRNLIIAALGIRIVGAFVFNVTGFNVAVAPDSVGYTIYGEQMTFYWQAPHLERGAFRAGLNPASFYQNLNGLAFYAFGRDAGLVLSLVNAFVGTLAAWVFSRLAGMLYGAAAVRPAFVLCAFWPSLVLWTSINLRDAWSFLLLGLTLVASERLRTEFSVRQLLVLGLCLAAYPFVRSYMLLLVSAGIAASYLVVRARQIPVAVMVLGGLVLALSTLQGPYAVLGELSVESKLESLHKLRSGLAYGSSAFEQGAVDLTTPGGALAYLPRGLANFLLAPFPWRLQSWRQLMALPETLAWYAVLASALRFGWRELRRDLRRSALVLFVSVCVTVAYALVEGNEGTAYRHRAHVLLMVFVLAAGAWTRRTAHAVHPAWAAAKAEPARADTPSPVPWPKS